MRNVVCGVVAMSVGGCATTPEFFAAKRERLSNFEVCTAWAEAQRDRNQQLEYLVIEEAGRRRLSEPRCLAILKEQHQNAAAVLGALAIVGMAAAASRGGSGAGGGAGVAHAPVRDYSWKWDLMNGADGRPVWVCRGEQTMQFSEIGSCAGQPVIDTRWPGLGDPLKSR